MSFKDISYLELLGPFIQQSKTICAMLVKGIMRNNSRKLFVNLDQYFRTKCH